MVPKYEREPDTEEKERGRRDRLPCASLCRRRRRRHLVAVCVPHHLSPSFASLAAQAGGRARAGRQTLSLSNSHAKQSHASMAMTLKLNFYALSAMSGSGGEEWGLRVERGVK